MFKRILAAIDVSEDSTKAAEVAIDLARPYGSDLTSRTPLGLPIQAPEWKWVLDYADRFR